MAHPANRRSPKAAGPHLLRDTTSADASQDPATAELPDQGRDSWELLHTA
jgi:hypothetical protein